MTIGEAITKLWNGVLALFGHQSAQPATTPADALTEALSIMSQLDPLFTRLGAALTRIAADKANQSTVDAAKDAQIASLQQQVADGENQIENELEQYVEQAEAISPSPALEATASLPSGTVGQAYTGAISISGGAGPYSVSSEPPSQNGLTINADGSISGTPEAEGSDSFDITVTDSASPAASVSLTTDITVGPAAA